jgi:hypothetical protein
MNKQEFSTLALAVDLVYTEYKTKNPVILSEKIHEDLGMDFTIHEISDYLDINSEDFPKESRKIEYYSIYNN